MKVLYKKIKIDIEKKIGFKISSTTEARTLLNLLLENEIFDLSLSTIRRFWGLLPDRKPHEKTLNALAAFLGYKTYLDYVTSKNRFEQLFIDEKIQRLKHKDDLSNSDFKFIESLYHKSGHANFVVSLFEHAVMFNKWRYIEQLFDASQHKLLVIKDHRNSFLMGFSYQVSIFLNSIPALTFNKIIDSLLSVDGFKTHVVYIYIDIININKRYGNILERINSKTCKSEEKIFLNLILSLGSFLSGRKPKFFKATLREIETLPDILKGRYYGYQILYYTECGNNEKAIYYFKKFKSDMNQDTYIINYLHEFINHLIFSKRFDMIDEIITEFYDAIMDDYNIHSYLVIFIVNINEVIFYLRNNNLKKAYRLFCNLDLEKIKYGSICDYYLIFYHILGYHIHGNFNIKNNHKSEYHKLSTNAKFQRFDDTYLETFILNK
ncbi:hypothetical protein [Winogradskyella sp.]|uniref:hypothetical protein n=1 Tax=Winogradskyella sp. TaxID=1883156 RepID=UPI003F6BCC73